MPIRHTIQQGDSTISLSEKHGLFARTIWDHPDNAAVKQKRKDMNVLMPGDVLVIPDTRLKEISKPQEQKHRFKRKGIPAKFRIQLFNVEEPRANQSYRLEVDGRLIEGTTDGDGMLEEYISPTARRGRIIIGEDQFTLDLDFGHLDPIEEISGVQQRLNNLGYHCGEATGEMNLATRSALRAFQNRFGLTETGEADAATTGKLEEMHDKASEFPDEAASQTA